MGKFKYLILLMVIGCGNPEQNTNLEIQPSLPPSQPTSTADSNYILVDGIKVYGMMDSSSDSGCGH